MKEDVVLKDFSIFNFVFKFKEDPVIDFLFSYVYFSHSAYFFFALQLNFANI